MIVSYDEMKEYLHRGECAVKFMKNNGDERLMSCTLNKDLIPEYERKTQNYQTLDRLIVWDLDKEAFRSFRLDSIIWIMAPEKEDERVA